jgi:hypothetical protein
MDGRCTEHLDRMYDGFNFGDATDDDIQRLISTETGSYNKDWRCKDISTEPSGSRMAAQSLAQAFKAVEASEARSKDQNLHRLMCQNMLKYAASRGMMTMRHSEENFYKSSGINPITIGLNPDRILSEVGSHTAGNWNCASIEY